MTATDLAGGEALKPGRTFTFGFIGDKDAQAGEFVTPNKKIATLVSIDSVIVRVGIIEKEIDKIFPGQKLKVPNARWSLLVDKSQNTLYLKADEAVVRSYRIATGRDGSTPEGTFKILNHLKNPTWYYEGKVVPPDSPVVTPGI